MKRVGSIHRRRCVMMAALSLAISRRAEAGSKYYVGGTTGYWSSTSSWSNTSGGVAGAAVPVTGDLVYVTNATGAVQTLTYNVSGSGISLGALTIDATGGAGAGNDTLAISANTLTIAGNAIIGNNGAGTVTQTGGTVSANLLYLAFNGGTGSYTMTAGTLSAATVDSAGVSEYVGYNAGAGSFNQTGGTNTLTGNLIVGNMQSSYGSYTLSGSAKLTVNASEIISNASTGTNFGGVGGNFQQIAGTHVVNGSLLLGESAGSYGFFTLAGGTLQAGASATAFYAPEIVGDLGAGDVYQSAGTHTIGTASAVQQLIIGNYGDGEYDMAAAAATLTVNGSEIVAAQNGSTGTFYQVNGSHTITSFLSVGDSYGAYGVFELDAGTLNVGTSSTVPSGSEYNNYEIIGGLGTGTLLQTGGTNTIGSPTIPQHLEIGYGAYGTTGIGTYNLSGGASYLNVYGPELVGDGAAGNANASGGTLNQFSGTHNISAGLYVGNGSSATGAFNLYGGVLNANQEFIANGGGAYGVFTQTGGTNLIAASGTSPGLFLGADALDYGVYTLDGSAASLAVSNLVVGGTANASGGTGLLNIESGTVTVSQQLKVWNTPGSTVNFIGGYLTVGSLNTSASPSSFNWTGGTLTINSAITIDQNFALGPYVSLLTGMTLVANGAITNNAEVDLYGGSMNASSIVNNSLINGYGTVITTGTFTNNLQLTQGAGNIYLVSAGTDTNAGTITLASGHVLSLASASLTNTGAINLNGASITGSGTLTNSIGGTVTGPGLITIPFSNSGVLTPGAGTLNITSAWMNNGVVELAGISSAITGGTITNNTTIQGYGSIGGGVANSGTIEAMGGTLVLGGTITNPAAGMMTASIGGKLLVASGLTTNVGLISLTGGTFDNGGFPLTNTGQITGYGTLRTGGLTNAGHLTLTGTSANATTTVTGNVTNNAGDLITIQNQPAIFTGNIVNNGTIETIGTTVTFAGSYSGNAYISDPSTNIFQSNVTISPGGMMTGSAGDKFIFNTGTVLNNGTFNSSGQLYSSDSFLNLAKFIQTGGQSWSAGTTFNNAAGTATFGSDAGTGGQNLSVNVGGGTATFTSTQHLASLVVGTGASAILTGGGESLRSVIFTPSLSIAGTVDLTGNDLDLQGGGTAGLLEITSLVRQGYNLAAGGSWNGTGITSSLAANDTTHLTALGVILNTASNTTLLYTSFDGSTVAVNDVLVKYTYFGDANLDGKVDGSDYSRIDNGYLSLLTGWYNGDFNYDGVIDGSDYTLIDNAFNTQGALLDAVVANVTAQIGSTAAVPEPGSMMALIAIPMLLGRRLRRSLCL